jgi:hypothetical protein
MQFTWRPMGLWWITFCLVTWSLLFQHMFNVGRVPEKWGNTLLTLAFKGGNRLNWCDYRPIAVVQVIAKVYGLVLNNRLNAWAESSDVRRPSQAGFRPAYNTHMNTFVLLNIIEKYKHLNYSRYSVASLIYTRHMTVSYVARRGRDCMMWVFGAACFMQSCYCCILSKHIVPH